MKLAARDLPPADALEPLRSIRNACVRALWHELACYPKPGLVSLEDNGSHHDMDAGHFLRSLFALRGYFAAVARAGQEGAPFEVLRRLAVQAECRMLAATGGVNTHRGAVFNLGLLAAAAGYRAGRSSPASGLGRTVQQLWGPALQAHRRDPASHGAQADRRHGAGGALAEALAGFPSVYGIALPAYRRALVATQSPAMARTEAFFVLLAQVQDTNLLHRGGAAGLAFAQQSAAGFLADGGVLARGWFGRAQALHREFVARHLSPGGSADLLAACLLVHALEESAPQEPAP